MINLLLILLFIQLIFYKPSNYLYCGIWGWVGNNPKDFSSRNFELMGLENAHRGKDSCGVFINNKIIYGLDKQAEFKEFIKEHPIPPITVKTPVVLGHVRKATSGKTDEFAQPLSYKDSNGVMHIIVFNGTIHNYEELAKKYLKGKTKNANDTLILLKLLARGQYVALNEYVGACAFAYFRSDKPTSIFLYHGLSSYYSKNVAGYEERPLEVYFTDDYCWFSSEKDGLDFLRTGQKSATLKHNNIYEVGHGNITKIFQVTREGTQYEQQVYNYKQPAYNWNNDYETRLPATWNQEKQTKLFNDKKLKLNDEGIPTLTIPAKMIYYHKGKYKLGNDPLNGPIRLNRNGIICADNIPYTKLYYFMDGLMLKDFDAYYTACKIKQNNQSGWLPLISPHVVYPIPVLNHNGDYEMKTWENSAFTYYTGNYMPLFSYKKYFFHYGDLSSIVYQAELNQGKHEEWEDEGDSSKLIQELAKKEFETLQRQFSAFVTDMTKKLYPLMSDYEAAGELYGKLITLEFETNKHFETNDD